MYVNAAYLNNHLPAVDDKSKPLIVTSCGNYRVKTRPVVETKRPVGRSDYQLLYIASGKGHFFIDGKEHIVTAGNIILYAKWNALENLDEYTINYVLDGGTLPTGTKTTYTIEDSFTLAIPSKDGYIFDGWYLDSAFSGE